MSQPMYGYTCFNYGQCRSECNAPSEAEAEVKARVEGWVLGLESDGQAHYACAGCAPALFHAHPIPLTHQRHEE